MPPKKAYESYDSESDCDSNSKRGGGKKQKLEKDSDEYKQRRERNNVAVRKSRDASRKKAKETVDRVKNLRDENDTLEQKVTILNKELNVLRDLFLSHASATSGSEPQSSESSASNTNNANSSNSNLNSNNSNIPSLEERVNLELSQPPSGKGLRERLIKTEDNDNGGFC